MATPKNNKYALGCTTNGRPPKYKTPVEMEKKIKEYFSTCKPIKNKEGKIIDPNGPTITGLALFLGFESRQSFYDYGKRKKDKNAFAYTIKRARMAIEHAYEGRLQQQACAGSIFALKNMGWKDDRGLNVDGKLKANVSGKILISQPEYISVNKKNE